MFDGEMLHRREYCTESATNLCCGCYLPVEAAAAKRHRQSIHPSRIMGVRRHFKKMTMNSKSGSVGPENLCSAHKLLQVRNRIGQLLGEADLELLDERDHNLTKNRFQVNAPLNPRHRRFGSVTRVVDVPNNCLSMLCLGNLRF